MRSVVTCRTFGPPALGVNGGVVKLAFTVQGLLYAIILPLSGYVPQADVQPASAVLGIRFLIAGTPLIAIAVAVWALRARPMQRIADPEPVAVTTAAGS